MTFIRCFDLSDGFFFFLHSADLMLFTINPTYLMDDDHTEG